MPFSTGTLSLLHERLAGGHATAHETLDMAPRLASECTVYRCPALVLHCGLHTVGDARASARKPGRSHDHTAIHGKVWAGDTPCS